MIQADHCKKETAVSVLCCGEAGNPTDVLPEWSRSLVSSVAGPPCAKVASDPRLWGEIETCVRRLRTEHRLVLEDCRRALSGIEDGSAGLVLTSPPYWNLKRYPGSPGQMGSIASYDAFLDQLDAVWKQCLRILVPGGRLVIVVGDVCQSRRKTGRHAVLPLHASIAERVRKMGFEPLATIIWYKISNWKSPETSTRNGSGRTMGRPYEPNAVVKNDVEYILVQKKPGSYRKASKEARILSVIPKPLYKEMFRQVWVLGNHPSRHHPASFPISLAERLVRMYSFVGDTVLDPFMGSATTNLACCRLGRNSIGIEVEKAYYDAAIGRLKACGCVEKDART